MKIRVRLRREDALQHRGELARGPRTRLLDRIVRGFSVHQDVLVRFLAVLADHIGRYHIQCLPGGAVSVSRIGLIARGELLHDVIREGVSELESGVARAPDHLVAGPLHLLRPAGQGLRSAPRRRRSNRVRSWGGAGGRVTPLASSACNAGTARRHLGSVGPRRGSIVHPSRSVPAEHRRSRIVGLARYSARSDAG